MNPMNYTGLLYAELSPWDGFAQVLDIAGGFDDYNHADSQDEADLIALASDWYAVGADLHRAITRYKNQVDQVALTEE